MYIKMTKKKKGVEEYAEIEVKIPDNVNVEIDGNLISIKGDKGELSRELRLGNGKIVRKDKGITLSSKSGRRKDLALLGTLRGDIKNMIHGVSDGIEYTLRIVYSHFPMSVKVQGNKVMIENFLGEKYPRKADILENVKVEVKGRDVTVSGIEKEKVAQTAANIEQATRIKGLDPRVFQDGCYIVEKDGRVLTK